MTTFNKILSSRKLTLQQVANYERQMPEKRKAIHLAIKKALQLPEMTVAKLARIIGVDRGKVYRMLHGSDIDQMPQRWAEQEDIKIKRHYQQFTYKQLAEMLARTESGICARVRALGLRKRAWPRQPQADHNNPF